MSDLINVGAFPNDTTGTPARTAFQLINGFAAGTVPIPALLVGPPTTNVPALTVVNQFGFDGIDINLNQAPGQGFGMQITGASPTDVRGYQVTNTQAGTASGTFGFLVGNDDIRTFIMGKTSSVFAGSRFSGSPAGEISFIQSGGNVPISVVVGAGTGVQVLGIAPTQVTVGNTPITGSITTLTINTSTVSGDTARLLVQADTSSVALFAANAAQAVAIVTGGPTGAQSVLRNLGNYPLVFGINNQFCGQFSAPGEFTVAPYTAPQVNGAFFAKLKTSGDIGLQIQDPGANSTQLLIGTANSGESYYKATGAIASQAFYTNNVSRMQIKSGGGVNVAAPASGAAFTVNGTTGGDTYVISLPSASTANLWKGTNVVGTISADLTNLGVGEIGTSSNTALNLFTNNLTRMTVNAGGGVAIPAPSVASSALTVNAMAAQEAISVFGTSTIAVRITGGNSTCLFLNNATQGVGTAALRIDGSTTTGAGVPTFANNKPTASSATATWLPISIAGVIHYIPCWQ